MTSDVGTLSQTEAAERSALISVHSYEIDLDLTGLPEGPEVRCRSVVRFSASAGADTFLDCCAEVVEGTLNGEPLPPAERGRIALADLPRRTSSTSPPSRPTPPRARGCTGRSTPPTSRSTSGRPSSPTRHATCTPASTSPTSRLRTRSPSSLPQGWTVFSNSGDPVVTDAGEARRWAFDPTPALSTYNHVVLAGPFYGVRREADGYDLGFYARAVAQAPRGPRRRRVLHGHVPGPCLLR